MILSDAPTLQQSVRHGIDALAVLAMFRWNCSRLFDARGVEMRENDEMTVDQRSRKIVPTIGCLLMMACSSGALSALPSLLETHAFRGEGGIMVLDLRIEDSEPMSFILDTGANPCVVDPVFAEKLGMGIRSSTERRGGAGTFKSGVADRSVTLTIGSSALLCTETLITDLSGLAEVLGIRPAGIVGGDFFRGRIVEVDYDEAKIRIHDRNTYTRPGGAVVPIHLKGNRPHLFARLSVPGGPQDVTRELIVDTGSLDHVDDPLLKESNAPLKPIASTGLGSGFEGSAGTWSKVEIGPYSFENVPGTVPSVPIVGNGILTRFNLVFDYDGGWLLLRPRT